MSISYGGRSGGPYRAGAGYVDWRQNDGTRVVWTLFALLMVATGLLAAAFSWNSYTQSKSEWLSRGGTGLSSTTKSNAEAVLGIKTDRDITALRQSR